VPHKPKALVDQRQNDAKTRDIAMLNADQERRDAEAILARYLREATAAPAADDENFWS
jgi:hypothetical protein